jgi:integrase
MITAYYSLPTLISLQGLRRFSSWRHFPAARIDPPALPDWDDWAPELSPDFRADCLTFVQCHLPAARPRLRRQHALRMLGELRRFLAWQLARRPIQHWGELQLSDLQTYQTARQAEGQANMTINHTLARVLSLLQELSDQGKPVEASVFRLRPLPRPDRLPRHLSETEAARLEAAVRAPGAGRSPNPVGERLLLRPGPHRLAGQ